MDILRLVEPAPFSCSFEPATRTMVVSGSVDEQSTDILRAAIQEQTRDYTEGLTVDLRDVAYLPSMGVGVLAIAMRRLKEAGQQFQLVAPEGSLAHRILTLGGLPHSTG